MQSRTVTPIMIT